MNRRGVKSAGVRGREVRAVGAQGQGSEAFRHDAERRVVELSDVRVESCSLPKLSDFTARHQGLGHHG